MIEDKLSPDERLRLECLAQANASFATGRPIGSDESNTLTILKRAEMFAQFVRDGK